MNAVTRLLTDHIDIWTTADTEKKSGRGRSAAGSGSVYGIKKLRELVLELATSGRLLDSQHEWKPVRLIDLGSWAVGSGFPNAEQGLQGEEIMFAKVSDMNLPANERLMVECNNSISRDTARRLRVKVHPKGTVIFPKIGGAIATNKRRILTQDTAIDNNCLGLTPNTKTSTEWLFLILSNIDMADYQAGTSVPALAQGVLQDVEVYLPPLAEQHRIVAKVDELMALCDQLEAQHSDAADAHEKLVKHLLGTLTNSENAEDFAANWQRIAAHFDTLFTTEASIDLLKQTILQLAVMGKLVPQDPNEEDVHKLLERFSNAKAKRKTETGDARIKSAKSPNKSSYPNSLPRGWAVESFENLFLFIDYRGNTPEKTENGVPLITAKNVRMGWLNREPREFISEHTYRDWMTRGFPAFGDLFFTTEAPLGNVCLNDIDEDFGLAQRVICLQPYSNIDTKFIMFALMSQTMSAMIEGHSTGMTAKGIKAATLKPLPIPIPPLPEQSRIVAKIEELMALCVRLSTRLTALSNLRKKLADELVAQAVA